MRRLELTKTKIYFKKSSFVADFGLLIFHYFVGWFISPLVRRLFRPVFVFTGKAPPLSFISGGFCMSNFHNIVVELSNTR